MAINRKKKEELLASYNQSLQNCSALFLTKYQGLSVNDMNALRKKLRDANGSYVIVKNTLAQKALAEAGLPQMDDLFEGPVGVSFCFGDPPPVAKALVDFAKDSDEVEIKGGLLGENLLDTEAIKDLAELPSIEVLRAQLLGVISAPGRSLR